MNFINLYHEDKQGNICKEIYKLNTQQEKVNDTPKDLFCQLRRFGYKHSWTLLVYSVIATGFIFMATLENYNLYQILADQKTQIDSYERLPNMQRRRGR